MSKYSFVILICCFVVAVVQADPEGRIVSGSTAKKGQFPYQVSIKLRSSHLCGGSIISKRIVLSTAHCFHKTNDSTQLYPVSLIKVQAGTRHVKKGGVKIAVSKVIMHPGYSDVGRYDFRDDIAIVKLSKPLKFSKTIKPIMLSTKTIRPYSAVTVSGWGELLEDGDEPTELQWTVLKSIPTKACDRIMSSDTSKLLCLDHPKNNGICGGDSGGPAVANGRLVGVATAFIEECGSALPDLFVNVAKYLPWIKSHLA